MEEIVQSNEKLYRLIKRSQPDSMAEGKPTSALFKQEDGVSVDRDGERAEENIINTFKERFDKRYKGLVRVNAGVCLEHEMAVIPAASSANKYHAEIYDNMNKDPLGSLKALILADKSKVVDYETEVKWVR